MKYLVRMLCLLAAVWAGVMFASGQEPAATAKSSNKHISLKYDKKKDLSTVSLKSTALSGLTDERKQITDVPTYQLDMEGSFSYPGQAVAKQVDELELLFHVVARANIFMKAQQIIVALDQGTDQGRAINLGFSKYRSTVNFNSTYEEFLPLTIPFAALERMTKAKTIDVYLGPEGYRLTDKQVQDLRDFGSMMMP